MTCLLCAISRFVRYMESVQKGEWEGGILLTAIKLWGSIPPGLARLDRCRNMLKFNVTKLQQDKKLTV